MRSAVVDTHRAGEPAAFWLVCALDFGERLAFHGSRALLILFFTAAVTDGGRAWSVERATFVYGAFLGIAYFLPFVGGLIGDRLPRRSTALVWGGVLATLGHVALALAASRGTSVVPGLVLVACGLGLWRPNSAALLGLAYGSDDARRDAGFTYFYLAVNAGAVVAGLVIGTLGERVGWSTGFAAAAVAMACATVGLLLARGAFTAVDTAAASDGPACDGVASAEPLAARQVLGLAILAAFSVLFNAAYEQWGGLISVYTRDSVDRIVGAFEIPTTWFQSLNPVFIVVLAFPLAATWLALGRRGRDPDVVVKFALGLGLLALGFAMLTIGAGVSAHALVHPGWIVATYFWMAAAELVLMPVGFSAATRLVPARYTGVAVGAWYATWSAGAIIGGWIGGLAAGHSAQSIFTALAAALSGAAALLLAMSRGTARLLGVRQLDREAR